eukprot:365232-Chlamydomonas_euryale.AAC.9
MLGRAAGSQGGYAVEHWPDAPGLWANRTASRFLGLGQGTQRTIEGGQQDRLGLAAELELVHKCRFHSAVKRQIGCCLLPPQTASLRVFAPSSPNQPTPCSLDVPAKGIYIMSGMSALERQGDGLVHGYPQATPRRSLAP